MDRGTVLITGANGALGRALVSQILRSPLNASSHGVYTVRSLSPDRSLEHVAESNRPPSGHHTYEILPLDLASLGSVRSFANDINRRVSSGELAPIRALVLNAGFQEHFTLSRSEDNFDLSFQVNHLAHFMLTLLLLKSLDVDHGRIVVIGSWMHDPDDPRIMPGIYTSEYRPIFASGSIKPLAKGLWSTPEQDPTAASGLRRYGASKLCQVAMMIELQRRLDATPALSRVCVSGIDPGGMPSGIMRRASFLQGTVINNIVGSLLAPIMTWWSPNGILRTPAKSAADILHILTLTGVSHNIKGAYFNGSEGATPSQEARDRKTGQMIWEESMELAGMVEGETALH
ncbi:hypothetical protein N0V93_001969 [Gnomoniopsis smithogilvyi]|uniref:Short-chain dehydrogenase n=1 Tax=Gnomoniopsis smithogilvyi TaxID=1191159 RepID=A0A9W8Z308_9PEZI|nr:hypothetical protein N0V93_001969 [Gnomoniopsis smithogilvyi]